MTIGAEANEEDDVKLKFYSGVMKKVFTIENAYDFQAYKIHGSGSSPIQLEFSPIVPIIPNGLIPNGIATIPINILDTSFIGSQTFTFTAHDPAYPQILKDETNVTFCISLDSSSLTTYYQDADGDGLGNTMSSITTCSNVLGYVVNDNDCDDNNPLNNPPNLILVENENIANDGEVCAYTTSLLSIDQVAQHYSWNNGDTTQMIAVSPDNPTEYIVTITYSTGCVIIKKDTLKVEGKIVTQNGNNGFGSLRNVLACVIENDTIGYDPLINSSYVEESLLINKSVFIINELVSNPKIELNFNNSSEGFLLQANKILSLKNIDVVVNPNVNPTFKGPGRVEIIGSTTIRN